MRDWFIYDFGWKIFSVFLAVAIWLTVYKIQSESASTTPTTVREPLTFGDVSVLIVSEAADVRDFHVQPDKVAVTVSGMPEEIAKLQFSQIRAFVDLTGIESTSKLQRHVDVSMPSGLTLVSVEPPEVEVVVPPKK